MSIPRKLSVGPVVVALGGVVEHHVEDDLDARPVEGLHHVAELVHRAERVAARAVGRVRREEGDRLVTPVVDQPRRAGLGVEREHRQQFDGGDAEFPEIGDLLDQPGERAAGLLSDAGARVAGESADVHLVDDGARGGPAQREVSLPVVRARIDDHALHRRRGVVACPSRGLAVVALRDDHAPAVRVEQDLGGIEPQPARGSDGPSTR